jgi:subtilisin family serine protease
MKKNTLGILLLFAASVYAQKMFEEDNLKYWYHQNHQKTSVYGVGSNDAHKKLKTLKNFPTSLIVAIIDSGVDSMHPDLKQNMWVNAKEIPNNKIDDDGNGYVDDIHGWNFIGNANGENVSGDTMELTRLYVKFKAFFDSPDTILNEKNKTENKEKYDEYVKIKEEFLKKSSAAIKNSSRYEEIYKQYKETFDYLLPFYAGKELSIENINAISSRPDLDEKIKKANEKLQLFMGQDSDLKNIKFEEFRDGMLGSIQEGIDQYTSGSRFHYNMEVDTRKIVGDNYLDISEKNYGNNDVKGPDALHGTHVAGIVSAIKDNGVGIDGIAGNTVKIMSVRAVPDGDERDKDVANAIIYAVDNGAKIINMSFGKGYSPFKERVWQAMEYAQSKDVLLVHAAGNDDENNDVVQNFPTNFPTKGEAKKVIENYITVGASTVNPNELKASFSNFGKNEVDIFAPGSEIYSTTPDNAYKMLQGTSMASPVVAGCAALLWSYFPKLSAKQVKEILMQTVNKNEKLTHLSVSGGVVDASKAIEYALTNYSSFR